MTMHTHHDTHAHTGHEAHACCAHSSAPAAGAALVPSGTIYTCPMHPEVRQVGPGHCPKCGMALEPMLPSAEEEDDSDLRALARRFFACLVLSIPVVAVAMGPHLFGWHLPAPWGRIEAWIE